MSHQNSRAELGLGPRAKTENVLRLPKRRLRLVDDLDVVVRPRSRGDCADGERPCPFVSCKYNLFLDVSEKNGSIKYNFPDCEPGEIDPGRSCALDIADQGGGTLEDIGTLANVTRERIRQIERKALDELQKRARRSSSDAGILREFCNAPNAQLARGSVGKNDGSLFAQTEDVRPEQGNDDDDAPLRVSFFTGRDEDVCRGVWTMFAKASNARGIDCRSASSVATSQWVAQRRAAKPQKEVTMARKRGELLTTVGEKYRVFEKANGRGPTARELFDVLGEDVAISVKNVANAIYRLRALGKVGEAPTKATSAPSTDATVAAPVATRDELLRKADALTSAIEALR